jgi:hypothetical protein
MKIKHQIIGEYATKRCFFDLGKQTQILTSMLQHPGYWHKNRFGLAHVSA